MSKHHRAHLVSKIIILVEIEDKSNFCEVVARAAFNNQHLARLWADAEIARRRLQAIRKYGNDFDFDYHLKEVEFDPARPSLEA